MVHIVPETRVAVSVEADHTVDIHGRSIRKDDPVPNHLHAILSVRNPGVVLSNETRTLWDEQISASGGIEHIGTDERLDFARKIGIQALLHNGWNLPACFDFVRAQWSGSRRAQVIVPLLLLSRLHKSGLGGLHVLRIVLGVVSPTTAARRCQACHTRSTWIDRSGERGDVGEIVPVLHAISAGKSDGTSASGPDTGWGDHCFLLALVCGSDPTFFRRRLRWSWNALRPRIARLTDNDTILIRHAGLSGFGIEAKWLACARIEAARRVCLCRCRRLCLPRRVGWLKLVRIIPDQRRVARGNLLLNFTRGCGRRQHAFGNARVVGRRLGVHLSPVSTVSECQQEPERDQADRGARALADCYGRLWSRVEIESGGSFDWLHLGRFVLGIILWGVAHGLSPLSALSCQLRVPAALVRTRGPRCTSAAGHDNSSSRPCRLIRRPKAPGPLGFEFQAAFGYMSWHRRRRPGSAELPPFHR